MDGRLGIRVQGGPPGTERIAENLSFFLFVPERLEEPILSGPNGAEILGTTEPFDVLFPPALDPDVERLGHHAICDPTLEFPVEGERPNPYPCGTDDANDCYDITIVSSTSPGLGAQIWGTPIIVEVENPKTPDARIVRAELGEPVAGAYIENTGEWTEPAITQDGRLLDRSVGAVPPGMDEPRDRRDAHSAVRPGVLGASRRMPTPCDVTGWMDFHPMSHAPYDPQMVGTYGLAAYPFRDSEGNPIADGEDMGGTYPWVDREGANIFMTGVPGANGGAIAGGRSPGAALSRGARTSSRTRTGIAGFMVAGLWTHGQVVHLDGMINNIDWAVGVHPGHTLDGRPLPRRSRGTLFRSDSEQGGSSMRYATAGGPYPAWLHPQREHPGFAAEPSELRPRGDSGNAARCRLVDELGGRDR